MKSSKPNDCREIVNELLGLSPQIPYPQRSSNMIQASFALSLSLSFSLSLSISSPPFSSLQSFSPLPSLFPSFLPWVSLSPMPHPYLGTGNGHLNLIIYVPKETHPFFCRTHRVCRSSARLQKRPHQEPQRNEMDGSSLMHRWGLERRVLCGKSYPERIDVERCGQVLKHKGDKSKNAHKTRAVLEALRGIEAE